MARWIIFYGNQPLFWHSICILNRRQIVKLHIPFTGKLAGLKGPVFSFYIPLVSQFFCYRYLILQRVIPAKAGIYIPTR